MVAGKSSLPNQDHHHHPLLAKSVFAYPIFKEDSGEMPKPAPRFRTGRHPRECSQKTDIHFFLGGGGRSENGSVLKGKLLWPCTLSKENRRRKGRLHRNNRKGVPHRGDRNNAFVDLCQVQQCVRGTCSGFYIFDCRNKAFSYVSKPAWIHLRYVSMRACVVFGSVPEQYPPPRYPPLRLFQLQARKKRGKPKKRGKERKIRSKGSVAMLLWDVWQVSNANASLQEQTPLLASVLAAPFCAMRYYHRHLRIPHNREGRTSASSKPTRTRSSPRVSHEGMQIWVPLFLLRLTEQDKAARSCVYTHTHWYCSVIIWSKFWSLISAYYPLFIVLWGRLEILQIFLIILACKGAKIPHTKKGYFWNCAFRKKCSFCVVFCYVVESQTEKGETKKSPPKNKTCPEK